MRAHVGVPGIGRMGDPRVAQGKEELAERASVKGAPARAVSARSSARMGERRESSTHAPQALELLNGDLSNRLAETFAKRLESEPTAVRRIDFAYKLATGKPPSVKERRMALDFLRQQPLREFALAMFNLNKFLYVE